MKHRVPWNLKGVQRDARDTARDAARRAGIPVSQWLDQAIFDQANLDQANLNQAGPAQAGLPHDRPARPSYAPPRQPDWSNDPASDLERAIAEISARQQALYRDSLPPAHPSPAPDLSGLERQLQTITAQLGNLNRNEAFAQAIAGLRQELSEIGHRLNAAMPRQALQSLENEVKNLGQRIAQSRQAGLDPALLANMERALGGLHQTLQGLTPAEGLIGFGEAVQGLSHKIDRIAASQHDPAALQQLEAAITALRSVVAHVASNDALNALSKEVRALGERVEQIAGTARSFDPEIINILEQRLSDLPVMEKIERGFDELRARIDNLQQELPEAISRKLNHSGGIHSGSIEPRPAIMSAPEPIALEIEPMPVPQKAIRPEIAPRPPLDPALPPDFPMEPGSATPPMPLKASPAERIAASEALVPDQIGERASEHAPVDFIAAARRAAQGAAPAIPASAMPASAMPAAAIPASEPEPAPAPAKKSPKRLRAFLIGTGTMLAIAASLPAGLKMLPLAAPGKLDMILTVPPADIEERMLSEESAREEAEAKSKDGRADESRLNDMTMGAGKVPPSGVLPPAKSPADAARDSIVTGSVSRTHSATPLAEPPAALSDQLPALLRGAALNGDAAAAYEIGMRYLGGRGIAANHTEAARWLDVAAASGLAPAQFQLGVLYEKGQGVRKDLAAARNLYLSAAARGNAMAMHNLAVLSGNGVDGKPDYKTAAIWFRKAAEYGVVDSQYNLGILYARGLGVEQDFAESYKWFALAADNGDRDSSDKRDTVAARLDKAALAAARRAAQTFTARAQPDEAITVKAPAGGWDRGEGATGARVQQKSPKAASPRSAAATRDTRPERG
jgi:localization factor PodJL